jgi:inner membrane protein
VLEELFAFPVPRHYGLTHTIPFVLVVGVVAAYTRIQPRTLSRLIDGDSNTRGTTFVFTTGAFWAGGLNHVFADLLSAAPDTRIRSRTGCPTHGRDGRFQSRGRL